MSLTRSVVENAVNWNYKDLFITAVLGRLEMSLQKIPELYQDERFEFAYSMLEVGVNHLAVFCYTPPIDLSLVKAAESGESEEYILAMSMQQAAMQKVVDEFMQKTNFVPSVPDPEFILTLEGGFKSYEIRTYEMAVAIAEDISEEVEKVHGSLGYANFLKIYKGLPFMESIRTAEQKFGLQGKLW